MENEYVDYLSRLQKIVLVFLAIDGTPLKGKTWYQKEIFLISKLDDELKEEISFQPNNYGPHSYEAEEALESLENEGLIYVIRDSEICLTKEGKSASEYLKNTFSKDKIDFYRDIKSFLNDLPKMELLAYIYQTNKKFTTKSVELEKVQSKILNYSIALYRKKKLSLAKAAEISGGSLLSFLKEIKRRGLKIETGI